MLEVAGQDSQTGIMDGYVTDLCCFLAESVDVTIGRNPSLPWERPLVTGQVIRASVLLPAARLEMDRRAAWQAKLVDFPGLSLIVFLYL